MCSASQDFLILWILTLVTALQDVTETDPVVVNAWAAVLITTTVISRVKVAMVVSRTRVESTSQSKKGRKNFRFLFRYLLRTGVHLCPFSLICA